MDDQATAARPFDNGPFDAGSSKPFGGDGGQRDPRYDNEPPLEARIAIAFQEELERGGVKNRIETLLASAAKAPACDSDEIAGRIGDFCKQAKEVERRINDAREQHNRPLLEAQRSLKAKADFILSPLQREVERLRNDLNRFMADKARKVREEEARREQEAIQARAAAETVSPELASQITPAPVEKPIARGELGAKVGTRKVWHHEIESVRQLPDRLLKHPNVIAALDKVIAAEIRGGAREIKGARIWDTDEAVVR